MQIKELILATKLPSKPSSLLQEILCDADLQHLAENDYWRWSVLLHHEFQIQTGISITENTWIQKNIFFFKTHHYFTQYAKTCWKNQKQVNLEKLEGLLNL